MKALVMVVLAMVMMFSGVAHAEWTKTDTALEITYQLLATVDYAQTRYIQSHPVVKEEKITQYIPGFGMNTYTVRQWERQEINPILGKHPSDGEIAAYFLTTGVLHAAISYGLAQLDTPDWMPCTWSQAWQSVTIGVEGGVVVHNFSAGVKMDF